mgnify:FL=1
MILENYMEIMVDEAIKDYLDKNQEIMNSLNSDEIIEIKACALNQLPPHYVNKKKGYAITKLEEVNTQTKATVLKTVIIAVEKITNNRYIKE